MDYPQLPAFTKEELESFLEKPHIARLCSHNKEGTIHVSPVWFRHHNGQILIGTQDISQKARNVKRNSNVTVEIDTDEWPYKGVLIYGRAELDYDEPIQKRVFINEKYVSRQQAESFVRSLGRRWKQVVIRITPQRIVSYDYSKD